MPAKFSRADISSACCTELVKKRMERSALFRMCSTRSCTHKSGRSDQAARLMSACPPIAAQKRTSREVRVGTQSGHRDARIHRTIVTEYRRGEGLASAPTQPSRQVSFDLV